MTFHFKSTGAKVVRDREGHPVATETNSDPSPCEFVAWVGEPGPPKPTYQDVIKDAKKIVNHLVDVFTGQNGKTATVGKPTLF